MRRRERGEKKDSASVCAREIERERERSIISTKTPFLV
jgi:hypothetical protein